jgi:hypothetical protein
MVRILIIFLLISAIAEGQRKFYGSIQTVSGSVIVDDTLKVDVIVPDDSLAVKVSSSLIVKDSLRADLIGVDDSVRVTVLNNLRGNANITVKDTLKADIITADDSTRATIKNGLVISGNGSELSRFGFSFTPTLQPNLDVKNNAGTTVLNVDSIGRFTWNNNSKILPDGTGVLFVDAVQAFGVRINSSYRFGFATNDFFPTTTNAIDLGRTTGFWRAGYINSVLASGAAAREWGVSDNTTANTAGGNFLLRGSGATDGATDKNGGMITIAPGRSTGTGFASLRLQSTSRATATATTYNTLTDRLIITSPKEFEDSTLTQLFKISAHKGTSFGVTVEYTIKTLGGAGDESHTETGIVFIMGGNNAAVTTTVDKTASAQHKTDAGSYTVTFSASEANPSIISVIADSDLDVNSIIYYSIINSDENLIEQL